MNILGTFHISVSWVWYTFPKGTNPKVNVIARLEFELTLRPHNSINWGLIVCRLLLCRGVRFLPTSALDMKLNYLIVRF